MEDLGEPDAGGTGADVTAPTGVLVTTTAQVSTLAGFGDSGYTDGPAGDAQFRRPEGIALDSVGNVFVADRGNRVTRAVSAAGEVTTLAGSGVSGFVDGPAASAQFVQPEDVVVDGFGNVIVADANNHAIRRISPAGDVDTVAGTGVGGLVDGEGTIAQFNSPEGLAVDAAGNVLVADTANHVIRRISPDGTVTTIAGTGNSDYVDGPAETAEFRAPEDIDLDSSGAIIVADAANHVIRRISPEGIVDTLAGTGTDGFVDGDANVAQFSRLDGLAVDAADNVLVADTFNHRIRLVTPEGIVLTLAGTGAIGYVDGEGAIAQFNEPSSAVIDGAGNLVICEEQNHGLRRIVGGGPGRLGVIWELALDSNGDPVPHHRATAIAAGQPTRSCESRFAGTACTLVGLTSGVDYSIVVVGVDAAGVEGPASEPVVVTVP